MFRESELAVVVDAEIQTADALRDLTASGIACSQIQIWLEEKFHMQLEMCKFFLQGGS